ncbi:hypothetical protein Tco_0459947 [Tanacetum coccineum]
MSDSEDSTVTYTEVSSLFEDLSDIGSPRVDGLLVIPEDPYAYVEAALQDLPSPYSMSGPEEPEHAPPSPDFVLGQVYPEFMPLEDDVLITKEKPLPAIVSPTADSPGYITKSDPEEDDEDPEEDPTDYPTDKDDDDDEEESSKDDANEKEEDKDKEHSALADSVPPPACRTTARMSIRDQTPIPFSSAVEIPSAPLPVSSPLPVSPPPLPASPTYPLGYRAAMIRLRAESPSTSHPLRLPSPITQPSGTPPLLPIPLPTLSPPLLLLSTDCKVGVFEVTLLPRKRLCIALGPRFEVGESSSAPTARPTGEVESEDNRFVMTVKQDTDEIYGRLNDAQDDRSLMSVGNLTH